MILIHVPSLKDRLDDIPLLTDRFLEDIAEEYGTAKKVVMDDAIATLQKADWTGNIRELRNVIERLVIMCGDKITADDVKKYTDIL